jgi:hypothetical protein
MTMIRDGHLETDENEAGVQASETCLFCGEPVHRGAFWLGYGSDLSVCSHCLWRGQLGALIGDTANRWHDVAAMLDATAREAWRAYAIARERER